MQRVRHLLSSSAPTLMGLSLMLVAGCMDRDGLGDPDGGMGAAGTKGTGTGTAGSHGTGAGGTSSPTGAAGVSSTGAAGVTSTGAAGASSTGAAGVTASTGAAGVSGAAGANGRAGTGGTMCGPVCAIYCPYGNVLDAAGCPTCKCNPAPVCKVDECGPTARLLPAPCGGTTTPPVCARDAATGKCAWTAARCACDAIACALKCEFGLKVDPMTGCQQCACNPAPLTCTPGECGPGPLVPSMKCSDGTVAGPVCARSPGGMCAWTLTKCPPTLCPAIACLRACPYGARVDANGCQTCDCLEPQACGAIADWKTCTADMRCTWLQPGCGDPALSTAGCFSRTDVGCTGDGTCANGRTCLKRVVNPCYNPGGGASCDACGLVQTVCL